MVDLLTKAFAAALVAGFPILGMRLWDGYRESGRMGLGFKIYFGSLGLVYAAGAAALLLA